jgi:hypothetical protein
LSLCNHTRYDCLSVPLDCLLYLRVCLRAAPGRSAIGLWTTVAAECSSRNLVSDTSDVAHMVVLVTSDLGLPGVIDCAAVRQLTGARRVPGQPVYSMTETKSQGDRLGRCCRYLSGLVVLLVAGAEWRRAKAEVRNGNTTKRVRVRSGGTRSIRLASSRVCAREICGDFAAGHRAWQRVYRRIRRKRNGWRCAGARLRRLGIDCA